MYPALLKHTKELVSQSLLAGRYDLYLVQAIFLLVHWREVADKSAFVNIGMAIRIGYQLGLHTAQGTAQSGNEASQVASRVSDLCMHQTDHLPNMQDRERTWYQCICQPQPLLRNESADS